MFYLICNTAKYVQFGLHSRGMSMPKITKNARAQGMVEYALILALVAIIVLIALRYLGPIINGIVLKVACAFDPNILNIVNFVDYDTRVLMSCDDLKD